MSRKAKVPIALLPKVEVTVQKDLITVKGPKGVLHQKLMPGIEVVVKEDNINVGLEPKMKYAKNFLGLYWSLISNMVTGVVTGFEKQLEMVGVGFRAAVQGQMLDLQIGVSHPVKVAIPSGIAVKVESNTKITVSGIDKHRVGQFAADIRMHRPPEPYKGKGIRYLGEVVRRKAGKAGKADKK